MRELTRDLVTILRTEARNQRTPPIDYAIAEDGGRMVVRPEPDIAMAELLEEAVTALAAKDEELVRRDMQLEASAKVALELSSRLAEANKALSAALTGLEAGCDHYADRTFSGVEVPGDEQYPWVRLMMIGRDAARRAREQGGE